MWLRRKQAIDLLKTGFAEIADGDAVQMIRNSGEIVAKSSIAITQSNQDKAYELSAIETKPRFYQGGLCRNEHKPAQIPRYTAARVGHQ
jgi:hypothetical protein